MGEPQGRMRTGRRYCMVVCLRGLIAQTTPRQWARYAREGLITKPDGSHFTSGREALDAHLDAITKGIEYAPIGKCDNFDVKSGCRGHDVPAELPHA